MQPDVDDGGDVAVVTRQHWRGGDGGWVSLMVVVVLVKEYLDVVGHFMDSAHSVPV
jgi:hypothetical protein